MNLKKTALTFGVAFMALGASATAALAAPAFATGTVNVREGPGTGYAVVDTLRRGESVDIQRCRGSWCLVRKSGPDGWVSANYLSRDDGDFYDDDDDDYFYIDRPNRRFDRRYHRRFRDRYDPFASFCVGNPNARFCISGGY